MVSPNPHDTPIIIDLFLIGELFFAVKRCFFTGKKGVREVLKGERRR